MQSSINNQNPGCNIDPHNQPHQAPEKGVDAENPVDSVCLSKNETQSSQGRLEHSIDLNRHQPGYRQQHFTNKFLVSTFVAGVLLMLIGACIPNISETVESKQDSVAGTEQLVKTYSKTSGNIWLMICGSGIAVFSLGAVVYNSSPEFSQSFFAGLFNVAKHATEAYLRKPQNNSIESEKSHSDSKDKD